VALARLLAPVAVLAALLAPAASAAGDPLLAPAGTCAQAEGVGLPAAAARRAMLCLANYARTHAGLRPLRLDPALTAAGDAKLGADVSCGEFTHTPCGKPFESVFAQYLTGASGYAIGENIAWATGALGSPRETMSSWLHSPGHRANLLTARFADLGIGYLPTQSFQGYDGVTLWSQEFGVKGPSTAAERQLGERPPRRNAAL
jgi:uncharacterized protein YkwD